MELCPNNVVCYKYVLNNSQEAGLQSTHPTERRVVSGAKKTRRNVSYRKK